MAKCLTDSYLILQLFDLPSYNEPEFYLINLTNRTKISIGRKVNSDIKLSDIRVSRYHAELIFDPILEKVYLNDLKSKFGTLILLKHDLVISLSNQ